MHNDTLRPQLTLVNRGSASRQQRARAEQLTEKTLSPKPKQPPHSSTHARILPSRTTTTSNNSHRLLPPPDLLGPPRLPNHPLNPHSILPLLLARRLDTQPRHRQRGKTRIRGRVRATRRCRLMSRKGSPARHARRSRRRAGECWSKWGGGSGQKRRRRSRGRGGGVGPWRTITVRVGEDGGGWRGAAERTGGGEGGGAVGAGRGKDGRFCGRAGVRREY